MFRNVIHPSKPGAAAEMAKADCRKSMKFSAWMMLVLSIILIAGLIVQWGSPDLIGITGKRLLGGIVAIIIVQGLDWITQLQRLRKLQALDADTPEPTH